MLKKYFELLAFTLIVALAAYLRLANVGVNPGWYSDEGTQIVISQNLLDGQVQYLGINQSTLLFAKLPLYPFLTAQVFRFFGEGVHALRMLSASLGVLSVGFLMTAVRRTQGGSPLALLSGLMLAIYPQAIIHSRLGFSYNLLAPLVILTYLGLWEYLESGKFIWLAAAAAAIGVGALSDLMILSLLIPFAVVASIKRWRDLVRGLPLVFIPFGIYIVYMLLAVPEAFLFDLEFTVSRLTGIPVIAQLSVIAFNYAILLTNDPWLVPALIGLFLLRPPRSQRLALLLFLGSIFTLGRTTNLSISLSYYYLSPLFPLVALGMASLVFSATPLVIAFTQSGLARILQGWGWAPDRPARVWLQTRVNALGGSLFLFLLVASPFVISIFMTVQQVSGGFKTAYDPILVNPQDAGQVAMFINGQVDRNDVVIASPAVAWMFKANAADFQVSLAARGIATHHLPGNIPQDRFDFDPYYQNAHFVVIDPIWRNWAVPNMSAVAEMVQQVESWPLAYQAGAIEVYRNPSN